MIEWLIQTADNHPDLLHGIPPRGLLSEQETAVHNALKTEKRRRDWLLGRWTAKHLLQQCIKQAEAKIVPLAEIIVLRGADGAPRVVSHPQFTISISHTQGTAFVTAVAHPDWPLGADIETISPRSDGFVRDYFTTAEQVFAAKVAGNGRDVLVTAIWSAKEAALKAIHQGLKVDTRCVSCLFNETGTENWQPFVVQWDASRLTTMPQPLDGWWRIMGDKVLTMTAQQP